MNEESVISGLQNYLLASLRRFCHTRKYFCDVVVFAEQFSEIIVFQPLELCYFKSTDEDLSWSRVIMDFIIAYR